MQLSSLFNRGVISYRDGVYTFDLPPVDIAFSQEFSPNQKNPAKWTTWRKTNYEFFKKELNKIPRQALILDFGVGPAQFEEILQKGFTVIGADFFPYEYAQIICDLTKPLPLKDETFDVVFASNVLEHLPNPQAVIKEWHRVLRPGGKVIGTVPFLLGVHQAPYDFLRYTYLMLNRMFKEAGFKKTEISSLGTGTDVFAAIQRHIYMRVPQNFWSKLAWRLQKTLFKLTRPVLDGYPNSVNFTLGYGFYAGK